MTTLLPNHIRIVIDYWIFLCIQFSVTLLIWLYIAPRRDYSCTFLSDYWPFLVSVPGWCFSGHCPPLSIYLQSTKDEHYHADCRQSRLCDCIGNHFLDFLYFHSQFSFWKDTRWNSISIFYSCDSIIAYSSGYWLIHGHGMPKCL